MSPLWLQQFVLAFVSNPPFRIVLAAKRVDNSCYRMVLSPAAYARYRNENKMYLCSCPALSLPLSIHILYYYVCC